MAQSTATLREDKLPAGDGDDPIPAIVGIRRDREDDGLIAAARGDVAGDPRRRFDGPRTLGGRLQWNGDGLAEGEHCHAFPALIRRHVEPALLEQGGNDTEADKRARRGVEKLLLANGDEIPHPLLAVERTVPETTAVLDIGGLAVDDVFAGERLVQLADRD